MLVSEEKDLVPYPSHCTTCNTPLNIGPKGERLELYLCQPCDEKRVRTLAIEETEDLVDRLCHEKQESPVEVVSALLRENAEKMEIFHEDLRKDFTDSTGWFYKREWENEIANLDADWYHTSYIASLLEYWERELSFTPAPFDPPIP